MYCNRVKKIDDFKKGFLWRWRCVIHSLNGYYIGLNWNIYNIKHEIHYNAYIKLNGLDYNLLAQSHNNKQLSIGYKIDI